VSREGLLDVAVVGLGPVGALLAHSLGASGLGVAVFEREAEIFALPRAVHLDAEAMRVLQGEGLAEAVLPWTIPTKGMEFVNSRGERYFGTAPRGTEPGPTRLGWHRGYMFYQPNLERELRAGVARQTSVRVHLRHEVESIEAGDDHVALAVRDLAGGTRSGWRARYLVGCDGAHSATRRWIGSHLESLGYDRRWLVVDTFLRREVELPGMSQQVCDPERPTTFIFSARGHRRWEFQLRPGETAEQMERPEAVRRLLSRWLGPDDAEVVRASVYEFHGVAASAWRRGRVLLAGDAAHQMPPFQGQGLCSGIRDVANLGWKLGWVARGRAPEALLDSYEAERAPHARGVVESSIRVGQLIDRLAAAEASGAPFEDAALRGNAARQPGWMPGLRCGLMPADPQAPAGELLVQPRVRLGGGPPRLLDDAIGPRFAVIAGGDPERLLAPASRDLLARIDARVLGADDFTDLDGWLDEVLERHAGLVVRPDRYVFGVARDAASLDALVRRLGTALGV